MSLSFTDAKTALIKRKQIDSWFVSRAHLNLYRGCSHNCAYCDGRAESYRVEGIFEKDIVVRQNVSSLLDTALNPHGKRTPLTSGYIMLGGGVSDSYQPVEKDTRLARACLKVLIKWRRPVHILTKSTLVERDLDLLQKVHTYRGALVSFSFSSVDDALAAIYEPGCTHPADRLQSMHRLVQLGIPTGMFLMPVIPGISDTESAIESAVAAAAEVGASFVVFSGMTLKKGRQWDHFSTVINSHRPDVFALYGRIYRDSRWGTAQPRYYQRLEQRFYQAAHKYQMPRRIPPNIFGPICDGNDRLQIVLSQLDYLQRAVGDRLPFGKLTQFIHQNNGLPGINSNVAIPDNLVKLFRDVSRTEGRYWYQKYL